MLAFFLSTALAATPAQPSALPGRALDSRVTSFIANGDGSGSSGSSGGPPHRSTDGDMMSKGLRIANGDGSGSSGSSGGPPHRGTDCNPWGNTCPPSGCKNG